MLDHRPCIHDADIDPPDAGHADARGGAARDRGDLLTQPLGDDLRFAGLGRLGDQELLTADARDDGAASGAAAQLVGDGDQNPSPVVWPRVSLTCLKRSRSSMITVR